MKKTKRSLTTAEGILVGGALLFAFLGIVVISKVYFPWYFETMFGNALPKIRWLELAVLITGVLGVVGAVTYLKKRYSGSKK